MEITEVLVELAHAIRRSVLPHLGPLDSRRFIGKTQSGDEAFAIDEVAETAIAEFIEHHRLSIAYHSENRQLVEFGKPKHLLIIDPIEGTRPAMAGLEDCVISIALAPYSEDACLSDVTFGCVLELKTGRLYTASKGGPAEIREGTRQLPLALSVNADLDKIVWSIEIAGRPAELIIRSVGSVIDQSSLRGGLFILNSTAYSLTRLASGQLNAVVDVADRVLRECPGVRRQFVAAGLGRPIGLFPYDIAAALLIAETAGCTVTDAFGRQLGPTPLLDTSESNMQSCVAASNPLLHQRLLAEIDRNMQALPKTIGVQGE